MKTKVDDRSEAPASGSYDISAVCRLTGLTSANLRVWEKRHKAVLPTRSSSGRRQYTRRDVQRLTLLKALADHGHKIMSTVSLPTVELEKRLEEASRSDSGLDNAGEVQATRSHACRICVIGSQLAGIIESGKVFPETAAIVETFVDLASAESSEVLPIADLLVVECPALFAEDVQRVRRMVDRCKALRAVVVYAYAQEATIEEVSTDVSTLTAIRSPISTAELRVVCAADIALANRTSAAALESAPLPREVKEGIPKREFTDRQLAAISQISSVVECECPHHLVSLVNNLQAFENYSAECESRNVADAEMHSYLHRMTAHSRAIVEDALTVLMKFEGIDIEPD